ncbi:MAG TPA: hypothetical protein VJH75_04715, partial [Patescibacteria group bacterium]|nr:hypothetical protein [Patescibacteria group bacterium]
MIVKKLTVLFVLAVVFIGTSAAQAEILTSRARLVLSGTVPLVDGAMGLSGLGIVDGVHSGDPIVFGYLEADWTPLPWLIVAPAVGYLVDTEEAWFAAQIGVDTVGFEAWVDFEFAHTGGLYYSGHSR